MRTAAAILVVLGIAAAQEPLAIDLDVRDRIVTGDEGQVYRSIVNLGDGPRLFGANLRFEGKDRVDLAVRNVGDPNSDAVLDIRRQKVYEMSLRYRTLAYFNNLPSFANPLLDQGILTSQRAIDLRRRQLDFDLRFKPRSRVTPFFSFLRTSGDGTGITPFVGSGDEFPVPTAFNDALTTLRGGAEFTFQRWSFILEEGRTSYTDEQNLESGLNPGNRPDTIVLDQLTERYRGSGAGWFSRGVLQGNPFQQLAFTGHFIYSRPRLEVTHELEASGVFRDPGTLRPYTNLVEQSLSDANQPRTSGSWSTEFRPHARWRIRHNWFSDAYQISGASPTAALVAAVQSARTKLDLRYDQSEAEISGDIGKMLTIRGGHRWIHSDAGLPPADLVFVGTPNEARIRRNVALGGATLNLWKGRARVHADFETSPGGETYFRTGLQDYDKLTLQGRVRLTNSLQITAVRKTLFNENVGIDFSNKQTALTAEWTPDQGRRWIIVGTYSREVIRSVASFIDPTNFQPAVSNYDDRGHHASAYADLRLKRGAVLHMGGALSYSDGTRPTRYYNPQASVIVPAAERVSFVGEWRWYSFRSIEAFRAHTISLGAQIRLGAQPTTK